MNEGGVGHRIRRDIVAIVARLLGQVPPNIDATADEDEVPENAVVAGGQTRRQDETRAAGASPAIDVPDGFPVPSGRVSSWFGMRFHPVLKAWREHKGVDIACPIGTPVRASAAGVVIFAGALSGYLRVVFVDHRNGMVTRYAHLSSIDVVVGENLERGDVLGASGTAGTGPHLHYEVLMNNRHVDPRPFMGVV